jgi:hypothetical protein
MELLTSVTSTMTPLLASQLELATKALIPAHLVTPVAGESFSNHAGALRRVCRTGL